MKNSKKLEKYLFYGFIVGFLAIASCTDDELPDTDPPENVENPVENPDTDPPEDVENPDGETGNDPDLTANEIQSKIILQGAGSKDGDIPPSSNLADLKIDKDTIFLVEGFKNRIRVLNPGKGFATGSTHFYIQVEGADTYYDIPAVAEESNDSIAVFYMGFDPGDYELPFSFNIKFAPSDGTGTAPIEETGKTVYIEEEGDFSCSPSDPEPHWDWMYTIIDGEIESAPGFGRTTQTQVTGCCLEGFSVDCISNGLPESEWIKVDGAAVYQINYEVLNLSNGGISGGLEEFVQNLNPDPGETDFCNGSIAYITHTTGHLFWGDYSYDPANGQIQFSNLESRVQTFDFGSGPIPWPDKIFIRENFLYEIISCHFLMETGSVEGTSIIRLFQRQKNEHNNWYD